MAFEGNRRGEGGKGETSVEICLGLGVRCGRPGYWGCGR